MQYILTQEEYNRLTYQTNQEIGELRDEVNELCMRIAVSEPVKRTWCDETKPWGCIHSEVNKADYCDECPVSENCHMPKSWSK